MEINSNPAPASDPAPAPAATPAVTPSAAPAATPAAAPEVSAEIKEKLERAEKIEKEYQEYRNKVDPVLETIYLNGEILDNVTKKHRERLGQSTPNPTPSNSNPNPVPVVDTDARNSQINLITEKFEEKVGIDKLSAEKKQELRGMVGSMIKEMLDPKGNKTITQVFEEVSLTKLPWYYEKAYDLVTKDSQFQTRIEQEKVKWENEQRGVIGGAPSSSIDVEQITLSPEERKAALHMNVSEADYLARKKTMIKERQS